ncbi:MAG: hypothetical protein WAX89_07190, partial [Alphaproteobacteria bacterium]
VSPALYITLLGAGILSLSIPATVWEVKTGRQKYPERRNWRTVFMIGLVIAFMELAIFMMYRAGALFSIANTTLTVGITLLTFATGLVYFKEKPTPLHILGLVLSMAGVILLTW